MAQFCASKSSTYCLESYLQKIPNDILAEWKVSEDSLQVKQINQSNFLLSATLTGSTTDGMMLSPSKSVCWLPPSKINWKKWIL